MNNKIYRIKVLAWVVPVLVFLAGCELDTKVDIYPTAEMLASKYGTVKSYGGTAYNYFNNKNGFKAIDDNLFAGVSDEAQHVNTLSNTQKFNEGNYNQFSPLDNKFEYLYTGIRYANECIEKTEGYADLLAKNRSLILDQAYEQFVRDTFDVYCQRNEMHLIEAYCYFELVKRYGGVPIVPANIVEAEEANLPRATIEEVFGKIESDINTYLPKLVTNWKQNTNRVNDDPIGRFDQRVAMAFKSRVLLYAASPLFSEVPSQQKWDKAALAAKEIIDAGWYSFHPNYKDLFLGTNAYNSNEVILVDRTGSDNSLETSNYPIGTPGGNTGLCPSYNLYSAYEVGDPRRDATFVKNGDIWNGRKMGIYAGGQDDPANNFTSRTGYYLKKFLNDNLDLQKGQTAERDWIRYRYAEIVLNYAEAMNEAWGPTDNRYGLTAAGALNMIRTRAAVGLPALSGLSQSGLRDAIKRERHVELAFEEHRYWDLRRWKDAESVLSQPIMGIVIGTDHTTPSVVKVTDRTFESKMNFYPIPENAIIRSNGVLTQNQGW